MKIFSLTLLLSIASLTGISQDYFPLSKGNVWNFKLTLDNQDYDYKFDMVDSTQVNGTNYFKSVITIPGLLEDSTYCFDAKSDNNIILTTDAIGAIDSDILFLHDPTNDTIIINGTDTADIKYFGAVTVPAGTFQDVYTSVDRSDSLTTLFFAPNIGYIRQDSEGETILVLETYNSNLITHTNKIDNSNFNIYPNPTSGILNIKNNDHFDTMTINDINGKLILNQPFTNQINVSSYAKGIYYLSISNNTNSTTSKFVVK